MIMSWKTEKISMPVSSAGILGLSPDMETSGIKVDPRTVIISVVALIIAVSLAHVLIKA